MKSAQAGFTLMEVLVAMSLMALVVAGLASMNYSTAGADARSSRAGAATALARDKLETLRSLPRTHAAWSGGTESNLKADGSTGGSGGFFTRVTTVASPYNGYDNLTRVQVVVSWQEPDNGSIALAALYR